MLLRSILTESITGTNNLVETFFGAFIVDVNSIMPNHRMRGNSFKSYKTPQKLSKLRLLLLSISMMIIGGVLDFMIVSDIKKISNVLDHTLNITQTTASLQLPTNVKIPDLFKLNIAANIEIDSDAEMDNIDDEDIDIIIEYQNDFTQVPDDEIDDIISDLVHQYYDDANNMCLDGDCVYTHVTQQIEQLLKELNLEELISRFHERINVVRDVTDVLEDIKHEFMTQNGLTQDDYDAIAHEIDLEALEDEFIELDIHPVLK